jgi:hypothetical protein
MLPPPSTLKIKEARSSEMYRATYLQAYLVSEAGIPQSDLSLL